MKSIISIWKKNMKKYFRNKEESIGSLIQPLTWLMVFGVGMSSFMPVDKIGNNYLVFLLPGMIGFTLMSASIGGGTTWLEERTSGIIKCYQVAPISRFSPLVANVLTVLSKAMIQSLVILFIGIILGITFDITILQIIISLIAVILFGFGFSGIALYFASKMPNNGAYHMVIFMFQMPLLFFSNALYSAEQLPKLFKVIVAINPMTYLITALRNMLIDGSSNIFTTELFIQILVLAVFAIIGMIIATKAYKEIISKA